MSPFTTLANPDLTPHEQVFFDVGLTVIVDLMFTSQGRLTYARTVQFGSNSQVLAVRELGASQDADFASVVNSAAFDVDIAVVFEQDGVIAVARQIDRLDLCTS
jgi:hypothetical protein